MTMNASTRLLSITVLAALLGAGSLLAAAPARAQTQLVAAGSEIGFTTRQMGVPVDGKFQRFSAQVALDPRNPAAGRIGFTIDTTSARFGSAELDAEIPKAIWLDTARHPQARFESTAIKAAGAGRFEVAGRLTIKGATREVLVPVTLAQQGTNGTATGTLTIKRLDFKVGEGEWTDTSLLANDVIVRFRLQLTGLPPA
jgi:polyisoprenoid-binding protein YceI